MRTGLFVVLGFAAVWGYTALATIDAPLWLRPVPVAVSAALLAWTGPRTPTSADRSPDDRRRVGRLVALWSGAEGLGVVVAISALEATGHRRFIVPAAALVVALHFPPLARALPFRPYYVTGIAMAATSLLACLLPGAGAQAASAGAAALILWATALVFPRRTPAAG